MLVVLAERRGRRAAAALGLLRAPRRPTMVAAAVAATAVALLGLAVSQPAIESRSTRSVRSTSEVIYVVDVSRSMRAAPAVGEPTRLDTAREVVAAIQASVADVSAGLAGMTDRLLPFLFPTADPETFDQVLRRSVLPEAPPPGETNTVATTFDALPAVGADGFYGRTAKQRACVFVTDGEARTGGGEGETETGLEPVSSGRLGGPSQGALGGAPDAATRGSLASVGAALGGQRGCELVVVRVGSGSDRIFGEGGKVEGQYRPDGAAADKVRQLAEAAGGRAFDSASVADAARAVADTVETGPRRSVGVGRSLVRLTPWSALLGVLVGAVLVATRVGGPRRPRSEVFQYAPSLDPSPGGNR